MGTPSAISLGAGKLYIAPVGSAEPADLTSAWDAAWTQLGYTEDGSEFTYALAVSDVNVAEELDPVLVVSTGRTMSVKFSLAEVTAKHLKVAVNGGTIATTGGAVHFEPPAIGHEVRTALGWESEDGQERWVYRKCIQTGSLTIGRKKAPNKALLAVDFRLELPGGSAQPFAAIFDSTNRG